MQKLVSPKGEEHGLLNSVANSSTEGFKNMNPDVKERAEKLKEDEARLVEVRYLNHQESENGKLEMPYCGGAGEPIQQWKFLSGFEYEVPYGLVKRVNESGMPVRSEVLDKDGVPTKKDGQMKRIHEMIPTRF